MAAGFSLCREQDRATDWRASRALRLFVGASGYAARGPASCSVSTVAAACRGIAFRIAPEDWDGVVAYLRAREQVTSVYLERMRPIRFADGGRAEALAYLVDRAHGNMPESSTRRRNSASSPRRAGESGANRDYVINTAAHLAELGMPDARLRGSRRGSWQGRTDGSASGGEPKTAHRLGLKVVDDGAALVAGRGEEVHVDRGAARRCIPRHPRQRCRPRQPRRSGRLRPPSQRPPRNRRSPTRSCR